MNFLSLIIHVMTFIQVGDFVSNELGMDLLGDALEPTKILGGTQSLGVLVLRPKPPWLDFLRLTLGAVYSPKV